MLKSLVFIIAIAACGGKSEPAAAASEPAPAPTEPAPAAGSGEPGSAAGSAGDTSACETSGGKCISMAAAVSCGPKSSNNGCPNGLYCCIQKK